MSADLSGFGQPSVIDEWYSSHDAQARAEGWGIFEVGRSDDHMYELSRFDDPDVLEEGATHWSGDEAVWRHVGTMALAGSPLHVTTIETLRAASPSELRMISTAEPTVRLYLKGSDHLTALIEGKEKP